jgi:GrpB-like predicted nucleotidyltransferase (UPF0157 family)
MANAIASGTGAMQNQDMGVVVPYDPEWPAQFDAERRVLAAALHPWLVSGVNHIGSTAIPGMPAKPVIDMIAGVPDLLCVPSAGRRLDELGYRSRRHRTDSALFVKTMQGRDTHHLHLTTTDSQLWLERLTFRDALRADARLVDEYARLKAQLLRASHGRPYDGADKRDFVRQVLRNAGVTLHDGLHAGSAE